VRARSATRHRIAVMKMRYAAVRDGASKWVANRRDHAPVLDLVLRLHERDRDIDGSLVGSALALRVFLFFVPLALALVGAVGFLAGHVSSDAASKQVGLSGDLANQIDTALRQSSTTRWAALLAGLIGMASAGRSMAHVLFVASRRAWRHRDGGETAALRVVGWVTGLMATIGILATVANRVRQAAGLGVATTTLVGVALTYAVVWFVVSLRLPRAPSDPSALLPGALLVGVVLAAMQWAVQFFIPARLEHASELYGGIGVATVALGWFFIIGRCIIASFVLNAVVWERFGSLNEFVFGLPGLRRIPKRLPRVARFFGHGVGDDRSDDLS
jgi:uncharacterized BrkB/YihY/UPF0761 family membrane protein